MRFRHNNLIICTLAPKSNMHTFRYNIFNILNETKIKNRNKKLLVQDIEKKL